MQITLANPDSLKELAELFDRYRVFYGQSANIAGSQAFLRERFEKQDSVIYTAGENGRLAGFTQLYPSFSSVSMQLIWILNDLYVGKTHRRKNVARKLMQFAKQHAIKTGALRIQLSTQVSNFPAQKLYETLGYERDKEFHHYSWTF